MSYWTSELQDRFRFSWDIVVALSFTAVCSVVVLSAGDELSALFGLPLLLFLPGYALFTAMFPAIRIGSLLGNGNSDRADDVESAEFIIMVAVGSLSLTMLATFGQSFMPWGITLTSILVSLCGFTFLLGFGGMYRRSKQLVQAEATPPTATFQRPNSFGLNAGGGTRREVLVTGFSSLSVLFAVGAGISTLVSPPRGETYSEFYLLTEDGELVTEEYLDEFSGNEPQAIVVGISNNEKATTDYEVIVELQRVESDGDDFEVLDREELEHFTTSLRPAETEETSLELDPELTGEGLRLIFVMYRDEAPATPSMETAYRSLQLWVGNA